MRRHTIFRIFVHLRRAYLHFERLAVVVDHCRVQRLIIIFFRQTDVIVELARLRLPQTVDQAQRDVTCRNIFDDHPHRAHVVDSLKRVLLALHLAIDRIDVFGTTIHFNQVNVIRGEFRFDLFDDLIHLLFTLGAALVEQASDLTILFGFGITKG